MHVRCTYGCMYVQYKTTLQWSAYVIDWWMYEIKVKSNMTWTPDWPPVKYDDLHRGESFTRQQTAFVPRHQYASPSPFSTDRNQPTRYQPTKPSLAALHSYPNNSYQDDEDDNSSIYEHSEDNEEDLSVAYVDTQTNPPDSTDPEYQTHYKPTLLSMGDVRSAIFSTYRGYCSELFVFGSCSKFQSRCKFDHSAATLELCIKSFTLLSKRDLLQHGFLPTPPLRPTPSAGHNNPYNSNHTYTPTVKPNGPLTHPVWSPWFTVLPRTTGQHINHDRMHHRSLQTPISQHLRTSLPPLLSNLIKFRHLILGPLSLILITQYLQHYSLDWPLPHLQLYSNYVNNLYVQVLSIMTAVLPCVFPLFSKIVVVIGDEPFETRKTL